jgi:hypothetical protein
MILGVRDKSWLSEISRYVSPRRHNSINSPYGSRR